jgi:2',3'-cyclic-nucleotide 2'-phosphodiesterase
MRILYVGDVMAEPGLKTIEQLLPKLRLEQRATLVIAQAENVTAGRGITLEDFNRLKRAGVDFCTGGNHIFDLPVINPQLSDPAQPIIRPANYPVGTPGLGWKYITTPQGRVLVISLLGQIVGRNARLVVDNPLLIVDSILESQKDEAKVATIVNFHGDFSSEKIVIGHYLDGRVTAVIGDHWHVPTADARVLPYGTAHITDVGMVGVLNSSLGVKLESIFERWRDGKTNKNELELAGARQLNAVLVVSDDATGLALSIEPINIQLPG